MGVIASDANPPGQSLPRRLSFASQSDPDKREIEKEPLDVANVLAGISESSIRKRIGRLMTPKADGTLKVPAELVKEWNSGDQKRLLREFQNAGFDKDFRGPPTQIQTIYHLIHGGIPT